MRLLIVLAVLCLVDQLKANDDFCKVRINVYKPDLTKIIKGYAVVNQTFGVNGLASCALQPNGDITATSWYSLLQTFDGTSLTLKKQSRLGTYLGPIKMIGNGKLMVAQAVPLKLYIVDPSTLQPLQTMIVNNTTPGLTLEVLPNGNPITKSDQGIVMWTAGRVNVTISNMILIKDTTVILSAVNPYNGNIIASCADKSVRVFDHLDGRLLRKVSGHTKNSHLVCPLKDGNFMTSASENFIAIWNMSDGTIKKTIITPRPTALEQLPNGDIISTSTDRINIIDSVTYKVKYTLFINGISYRTLVYPNGDFASCGADGIKVWRPYY